MLWVSRKFQVRLVSVSGAILSTRFCCKIEVLEKELCTLVSWYIETLHLIDPGTLKEKHFIENAMKLVTMFTCGGLVNLFLDPC